MSRSRDGTSRNTAMPIKGSVRAEQTESRCGRGESVVRGAVSAATRVATDLRYRADRSCLPVARLPLSADQPAPDRDLRHLGRGSSRTLGARLRAGAGGCGRRHRRLDHEDRRAGDRHRGRRPARRSGRANGSGSPIGIRFAARAAKLSASTSQPKRSPSASARKRRYRQANGRSATPGTPPKRRCEICRRPKTS